MKKSAAKAKPTAKAKSAPPKKTEKTAKKAPTAVSAKGAEPRGANAGGKGAKKEGARKGARGNGEASGPTCRVIGCNAPATTAGYSRTCYIKYWKQIKLKEQILREGTLERFLRELVEKYPEKVLFAIHNDLASEEAYAQMIRELDLYGGIDELEHEPPVADEEAQEGVIEDIKKDITKEEDLF